MRLGRRSSLGAENGASISRSFNSKKLARGQGDGERLGPQYLVGQAVVSTKHEREAEVPAPDRCELQCAWQFDDARRNTSPAKLSHGLGWTMCV
jgi:hypothetical protein